MKEIVPTPPPIIRNQFESVRELFTKYVVPSYGRFELALSHGAGSYLYDVHGQRYLDLGGGIAVCSLGHAHPAITEALVEQSKKLIHISNLYYQEPQGRLAQALVQLLGPGKIFFSNSGGEANEGLFKLARKFGHDEGRFEILTTVNSFHGRTLAGISATGQDKVKKGFEPMTPGFRHVPYNDLAAMRAAISPATVAIMIEGIQGEGGVTPATPDYLLGLRQLCNEKKLLLFMDSVQCGHFRSGRFQSFQRILETCSSRREEAQNSSPHLSTPASGSDQSLLTSAATFQPDGVSMAKSLGGGFPMGAFWVRAPYADLLGAGTHGTTYGGSPLACAVGLKVLEVIEREKLADNVRQTGDLLKQGLQQLVAKYPPVLKTVRGLGFMLGLELAAPIPALTVEGKMPSAVLVAKLQDAGLLVIPAGPNVIRFLPALNLSPAEAREGLQVLESVIAKLAA
jgi:acetylornithine aminotransferase/acetylornithine/N-succinyldiaminopimelate aminotransferase